MWESNPRLPIECVGRLVQLDEDPPDDRVHPETNL